MSDTTFDPSAGYYDPTIDGGDAPDYSTVSIGDFVFDGWEIPESIKWGGAQKITVHKLVGGDRVIDTMGPDHADISWSGIMLSPDASLRADELDQMRQSGVSYPLIFANRYYEVVISNFQADQRKAWHVPYTITCVVYRDQSFVAANPPPPPLASVTDDVTTALAIANGVTATVQTITNATTALALAPTAAALALVPTLLLPMTVIDPGAAATIALAGGLAAASTAAATASTTSNATIAAVTAGAMATGIVAGTANATAAVTTLAAVGLATQEAAAASATAAYINRASVNVANA